MSASGGNHIRDSLGADLERAVATALAAGAADAEVSYAASELLFLRFAGSRFTQVGTATDELVRIRALVDGRLGSTTTGGSSPEALVAAARNAVEAARSAPPLGLDLAFSGEADDGELSAPPLGDAGDPDRAPALVRRAFDRAARSDARCYGALKSTRVHRAVRSASGLARAGSSAAVDFQCIALADSGPGSGFACYAGSDAAGLDPEVVAGAAADIAAASNAPVDLGPGRYDVVLAPAAVAELLEWMAMASFHGRAVLDGTSLLAGRAGQRLFDPGITIADDALRAGLAFDSEGVTRQTVALIEHGVIGAPVTDRATALRLAGRGLGDGRSTGHACALDDPDPQPFAAHLSMRAGDSSIDELIGGIERGLYVTRLHYVNGLLDTRAATMTGMTRDGAFLIEGGKRGPAVNNLRFTDSLLSAWSDRLLGVLTERQEIPSFWMPSTTVIAPAVAVRDFHFTGRSR